MVIGGATLITGSSNFTKAMERRTQRIFSSSAYYLLNWETHIAHSKPYAGRSR
jgi:hypothetical protein